jgi:hypothetical protein
MDLDAFDTMRSHRSPGPEDQIAKIPVGRDSCHQGAMAGAGPSVTGITVSENGKIAPLSEHTINKAMTAIDSGVENADRGSVVPRWFDAIQSQCRNRPNSMRMWRRVRSHFHPDKNGYFGQEIQQAAASLKHLKIRPLQVF